MSADSIHASWQRFSGVTALQSAEVAAVRTVFNRSAFEDLNISEYVILQESSEIVLNNEGQQVIQDNFRVGTVVCFPTSETFSWTVEKWEDSNWHAFMVANVLPGGPSRPPNYVLESCGLVREARAHDTCFIQKGDARITLPFRPERFIQPVDTTRAIRAREELSATSAAETVGSKRKANPSLQGKPYHTSSSSSSLADDNDGYDGVRTMLDADGQVQVFQTTAAQVIQRTMKPFWRAMEKEKRNVLVPNNTLEHETWEAAMLQYQRREPPEDSTPAMASFYKISALALSRVQTDPAVSREARSLSWAHDNWDAMSILFFLPNPSAAHLVTFDDGIEQAPRTLLADAIDGWKLWMTIHFDHRYEGLLIPLTTWLRDTSNTDATAVANIVLRYWVEQLFQDFTTTVSRGGSQPRIATCKPFNVEGAVHGFLVALETELLSVTIPRSTFPHALVRLRMEAQGFMNTRAYTPRPSCPAGLGRSPHPFTSPLSATPAPTPARQQPAKICTWHAAYVLGVGGAQGQPLPCRNGTLCAFPHIDPAKLTPAEVQEAATEQLRPNNTALGANLRLHLAQTHN
jgi:hypothetical protein